MPKEYAGGSRPRGIIERGIRNAVKEGTLSRGDIKCMNLKRRARGLSEFDIEDVQSPPDEVVEIRRAAGTAKLKAMESRSKKKPAAKPVAKPAPKSSSSMSRLTAAKKQAEAALAKANAAIARAKKK